MAFDLRTFTGIGRPLDAGYRSNRLILLISALAFVGWTVAALWLDALWLEAAGNGFRFAVSLFLAWAVCREIDPDHVWSAFAVLPLIVAAVHLHSWPDILAVVWLLMGLRFINRTTGLPPTVLDAAGYAGLTAWLAVEWSFIAAPLAALAILLNVLLGHRERMQLAVAAVTAALLVLPWVEIRWQPDLNALVAGSAVSVFFLLFVYFAPPFASPGDETGRTLSDRRMRWSHVYAMVTLIASTAALGMHGLVDLSPLVATMLVSIPFAFLPRRIEVPSV